MAEAARSGWQWTMLSYHCRRLYGDKLFELLSSVKNISLQRKENEVSCMLQIFNAACEYKRKGSEIDWAKISSDILRTKPAYAAQVPIMIKFVKHFGGGVDSTFVPDFGVFHRKFAAHERNFSDTFFDGLCSFVLKRKKDTEEVKAPLLQWAVENGVHLSGIQGVSRRVQIHYQQGLRRPCERQQKNGVSDPS